MFLLFPPMFGWDLLILTLLCFGICSCIICIHILYKNCIQWWKKIIAFWIGALACICTLLLLYGTFIEPYIIVVSNFSVPTKLKEPLTVAVISDIHVRPGKNTKYVKRIVQTINDEKPDVILLAGDFVFDYTVKTESLLELKNLSAPLGVFAVLGNHDQGNYRTFFGNRYTIPQDENILIQTLLSANIHVLRNQADMQMYGLEKIVIAGVDDMWSNTSLLGQVMPNIPKDSFSMLLCHNPSIIEDERSQAFDMIISGHTHGGQIRLPFLGSLATLPISIAQTYDQGLFAIDQDTTLAITRGIGESGTRVRLFAWPQIMMLHLQ